MARLRLNGMQRKYFVCTLKGVDIEDVDRLVASETNIPYIPDRVVDILDGSKRSSRVSIYSLTETEAERLSQHSSVQSVDLHVDELGISETLDAIANDDYRRNNFDDNELGYANYGLLRHTSTEQFLYDGDEVDSQFSDTYTYNNTGEGVDVFIVDTGVEADHPDFLDEYGISRVQKIDWSPYIENISPSYFNDYRRQLFEPENYYVETEGFHGTQCASIAAGKDYGFAKKAHIYSCKANVGSYNSNHPPVYTWYQAIKLYVESRRAHGINRPAVVNISLGFAGEGFDLADVTGGIYADADNQAISWSRGQMTDEAIANAYGIIPVSYRSVRFPSIDAYIDELTDAGIHVVISAGNHKQRQVKSDHPEYDNQITFTNSVGDDVNYFYNRPSTPNGEVAIRAGALNNNLFNDSGTEREQIISFSSRGSGVDLYAASGACFCASAQGTNAGVLAKYRQHPDDSERFISAFSGTSCAAPQIAGVIAQHLSNKPHITPEGMRDILFEQATDNIIYESGSEYYDDNYFADSHNRVLFSKFNQNNTISATGTFKIRNANIAQEYKFKTDFRADNIIFKTNGVSPDNLGFFVSTDTSNVYENSKIRYITAQQHFHRSIIELVFDAHPAKMKKHSWRTLELYNQKNGAFMKLHIADAVFDPIKQTFKWVTTKYNTQNTNPIFSKAPRTENTLGLR
jgi:subtilisin family serine protease